MGTVRAMGSPGEVLDCLLSEADMEVMDALGSLAALMRPGSLLLQVR
jgi:hypothetical protein